jgi:hypothetical protein
MFIFGYVTCKTFYFFRSARLSLVLVKSAHVIYLSSVIKAIEHLAYAREIMLEHMLKSNKNSTQISSFEIRFDEESRALKKRSIEVLQACHPDFFHPMMQFEDWPTAMEYLLQNQKSVFLFWEKSHDK